ncbi:MAG: hypothetical protein H6734_06590 [Alphaproteobacteria bacterium]|nr:hypothetical protein [Alphaproteobacteria bacterium]
MRLVLALSVLAGCGGEGLWEVETYGEPYIEDAIPASAFEDGCSVRFSGFTVALAEASLVDGDGTVVGGLDGPLSVDVHGAGPHAVGTFAVPAGHYDHARFVVAPGTDGTSIHAVGALTCDGVEKSFDWRFATSTVYDCEPEDLTVPVGGVDRTQLTIHGDHLFYDGLENPDALVRGRALFDADGDDDGAITLEELSAVPVAPLGYQVGRYAEVVDLAGFVEHLTGTVGHVDGEGHCTVSTRGSE